MKVAALFVDDSEHGIYTKMPDVEKRSNTSCSEKDLQRFWKNTCVSGDCIVWTASKCKVLKLNTWKQELKQKTLTTSLQETETLKAKQFTTAA